MTPDIEVLKLLREPFPESEIEMLPKGKKKSGEPEKYCDECGAKHQEHFFHISYVGHAKITAKLLDIDPLWAWAPLEVDGHAIERDGAGNPVGLWITLTVGGMTRVGHGSVEADANEAMKELIGDALRNAAMRFGLGLDLWIKTKKKGRSANGRPAVSKTANEGSTPSRPAQPKPKPKPPAKEKTYWEQLSEVSGFPKVVLLRTVRAFEEGKDVMALEGLDPTSAAGKKLVEWVDAKTAKAQAEIEAGA